MESSTDTPKGLGGWLILPGLGLIFTPVHLLIFLYQTFLPLFQDGTWEALTTPGSEAYHHLWGPYLLFEIVGNFIFVIFSVLLIFLFFSKSHRLPKLLIIFYVSNLLFLLTDFFMGDMIPFVAAEPNDPEVIKEIAKAVMSNIIWVPYFLLSKRVKNTFVKTAPNLVFEKD